MIQLAEKRNVQTMEDNIKESMLAVVNAAKTLIVSDDVTYQSAAETLKLISDRKKQVQEYWDGPKKSAAKAHKDICAKEKSMLSPLSDAESTLKRSMADYSMKLEAMRRAEAAELERRKQEERERLLAAAITAEQTGDTFSAELSLNMAEMVDDMKVTPISSLAPKAEGISVRKTWKARITDDSLVPIHVAGICLRPVDVSALTNLARATKGSIQIPGVQFYEDANLAVR